MGIILEETKNLPSTESFVNQVLKVSKFFKYCGPDVILGWLKVDL